MTVYATWILKTGLQSLQTIHTGAWSNGENCSKNNGREGKKDKEDQQNLEILCMSI